MALTDKGATTRAILLATAAVAAMSFGATEASAAPDKRYAQARTSQTYDGPPRAAQNYSYKSGPRTRVYVTRRSWLDAGTEVQPGERKFTDYAFPPGYSYGRTIDRIYQNRQPLGDRWDTGIPTPFPIY
ncbi:MAG: hypothetical protein V4661_03245 [Pseudomonadota bacterium]